MLLKSLKVIVAKLPLRVVLIFPFVLTNKTSVSYDIDLDLSALSGYAEYEVNYLLDSYSDDVGFGAAWSDSVDLVSGDIFTYDETFALSGFGTESYQFGFDV